MESSSSSRILERTDTAASTSDSGAHVAEKSLVARAGKLRVVATLEAGQAGLDTTWRMDSRAATEEDRVVVDVIMRDSNVEREEATSPLFRTEA